jgi:hypothetical protein
LSKLHDWQLLKKSIYMEIIRNHQCGFRRKRSTIDHIFISCIRQILEKKCQYNEAVHQLVIDFKKAYDSVRREVLYNTLIDFGVSMKLVRLIKMCLNEMYSKVRIDKHSSVNIPIQKGLNKEKLYRHCFRICHWKGPGKRGGTNLI